MGLLYSGANNRVELRQEVGLLQVSACPSLSHTRLRVGVNRQSNDPNLGEFSADCPSRLTPIHHRHVEVH